MLCRIHTAYFGAVFLALLLAGGAAGAHALYEYDGMGMLAVGGTEQRAARGACRVHKPLKLQGGYNILGLRICKLVELLHGYGVEAGSRNDSAVPFLDILVLGVVVDSACGTYFGAYAAFAGFQHGAVVGVYGCDLGYCLCEGNIYGAAVVHAQVKFVGHIFLRTFLGAESAAGTNILLDISRLSLYGNVKVAYKALDIRYLGIGEYAYFFVLRHIHHFRRKYARRAVQSGEGLVKLSHFAAYGRLGLNYIHRKSRVCNIQSGLYAGNAAADDKSSLCNGRLAGGKRRIEIYLGYCRLCKYNSLFCTYGHILMYP